MKKLKAMREGGKILGEIRARLYEYTEVGVSPSDIENKSRELLAKYKVEASFLRVPGYNYTTCINLNAGIVHGLPVSKEKLIDGDLVTVDVGVYYGGYHTDAAFSKVVGVSSAKLDQFLATGLKSLEAALSAVKPGNRIGNISEETEKALRAGGVYPTEELTGHGVGRDLHEEPMIPNYLRGKVEHTPQIVLGQTLAIENIYVDGKPSLFLEKDGWTISDKNGKLSAVFEETVEVVEGGFSILTTPSLFQIS